MRIALTLIAALAVFSGGVADATQDSTRPGRRSTGRIWLKAADNLAISAELYVRHEEPTTPFLVLLHDSRKGRSEFKDIAPRLANAGFNSMAVDLRAGKISKKSPNHTASGAARLGRSATILDVELDVVAALEYAKSEHPQSRIIAIGCASSASMALRIAATRPELIDGVVAFSAGEFYEPLGMSANWIEESAGSIQCPVFMTSARAEWASWSAIFDALATEEKIAFLPTGGDGVHGVRALSATSRSKEAYWKALLEFLREHFPSKRSPDREDAAAESSDE